MKCVEIRAYYRMPLGRYAMNEQDDFNIQLRQKRKAWVELLGPIEEKLAELSNEKKRLLDNISAADQLLAGSEGESTEVSHGNGHDVEDDSDDGRGTRTGIRDRIRATLRSSNKGLKPKEVTNELTRNGFSTQGKTDLSVRVANEMWRMERNGLLKKRAGRYYLQ